MLNLLKLYTKIRSSQKLKLILLILIVYTVLYSFCATDEFKYGSNHNVNDYNGNFLHNVFNKFYFTVVTTGTIGYGDIQPQSLRAKILAITNILAIMYVTLIL